MGQYRVARMALEHALKLKPDQFEAAVTLGELDLDLGNARRGADVLEMAARLRPGEFGVWRALGRALDDLNETDGAAQAYQKALELRPEDREITIQLIALLINSGQSGLAGPRVDQALQKYPDDPIVLGLAARRAFDADRIDEALSLADRALRRDPRSPDAALARLRCLVARSRWPEALAAAERAVVDMPNDLVVIRLLWTAQTRLGLTERAAATQARYDQVQKRTRQIVELTEDVNSHPDDPEIRWRLGQLALDGGSILAADRCFEAALAVDPDYRPARESLAALRASHPELVRDPGPRARPGVMRPIAHTPPAQGATPAVPAGHR
jgi:tetratricopeptide (TPR) repeat protein